MRIFSLIFCLCVLLAGVAQAGDSLHFRLVGRWSASQTTGVAVAGRYAFVTGGASAPGLYVISVADPAHPVEVGRCSTLAIPRAVAVSGGYAYFADDVAGLRVISVADPAHPIEVGRVITRGPAEVVSVSGDCAFVLDTAGLSVISITDPSHPAEVGHCSRPPGLVVGQHVEVVGDYAYVTYGVGGLRIVSVADPAHPVEVGNWQHGNVSALAVSDGYAYVSSDLGFVIISVFDPTNPVEIGRLDSVFASPTALTLVRGYALCANMSSPGLQAISIADPTYPTYVGYYVDAASWSVVADGDYIYDAAFGLTVFQFYQPGDLDVDNDSLDVANDTLRLRRWTTVPGESLECVRGEFILANTSASYNPDPIDGPSISPVDSLSVTGSLAGPGGTIDSIVIPNLPFSLAQGQTMVCTLAAYLPMGLKVGGYTGTIYISGKDTANLQVYESCYVRVSKLGDIDVDNDSLDVVADTIRARIPNTGDRMSRGPDRAVGAFVLANTSASYNPDTTDGPSLSWVDSLSFTATLTGPGGTLDSIFIQSFPVFLAQGQAVVCTLVAYVPESLPVGDYAGPIVTTGFDSVHHKVAETVYALVKKGVGVLGDLDVDNDSLDVAHDTMNLHTQPAGPVYHPYAKAEFMLVNTSNSYNPDTADGPSRSTLREVEVEAKVKGQGRAARRVNSECRIVKSGSDLHSSQFTLDSSAVGVYVLNLPESLAVGQAVKCTLALVIPVGETLDNFSGIVTISAYDTLGYQVRDSFFLAVRGPQPRQNLDSLRVAPIPFKPNQNPEHDAIHFQGLTAGARVIVYDASGQSVWSATESGDGHLKWDAKVASGIYVYLVVSADGKNSKVGKLSVIR